MATVMNATATMAEAKQEQINDKAKFFKHQLFLAGLSDSLRVKVLEAKIDTFSQGLELACKLESIKLDHKHSKIIAAIKAQLSLDEADTIVWEHLTEEEIKQVATIRAHNNRFPPRNNSNRQACSNG
jgi:hypothetical protein